MVITVIALFSLFIAVLIAALVLQSAKQKRAVAAFFGQLSPLGARGEGLERELTSAGRLVSARYSYGSKSTPSRLILSLEAAAAGALTLRREGSGDIAMERLGLESDVESGDPLFDDAFHVDTDDDAFAAAYFASQKKREAAKALFAAGCSLLELDGTGLRAYWSPFQIKESTDAGFVREALPQLAALASDLPAPPPGAVGAGLTRKTAGTVFGLMLGAAAAGYILLPIFLGDRQPIDGWDFFVFTLRWSAPAWLALVAAAGFALKGKSWFLAGLSQTAFAGALLAGVAGYWGGVYVNAGRDPSEPVLHQSAVSGRHEYHGRNSTTYTLYLRSWRREGNENIDVRRSVFERAAEGCAADVRTKPGALGFEFITDLSFDCSRRP